MKRRVLLASLFVAALALVYGVALFWSSRAASGWKELHSIAQLRDQFNQDKGSTRIVLLLSPT